MRLIIRLLSISLILLLLSCEGAKDKPLEDLGFIMNDAFPPCERIVTKQTEKFTEFSENLYLMDSLTYYEFIANLEAIRKEAVATLETGIAKVSVLSNENGNNLIRNSTLKYFNELLKTEKELGTVLKNHPEDLERIELYSLIYEVYERNDLEEKGQTFVEEQYEFMRRHRILERDVEKVKAKT